MRTHTTKLALCLALIASLVAMAFAQGVGKTDQGVVVPENYVLGPEDVINILTRDVAEASGDFLVRLDGKISFPLVGEVMISGLTTSQVKAKLEDLLKKELRDPQVTVNVKQMKLTRVYVLGAVGGPGIKDYRPGWRLTELIASCGGLQSVPERLRALVIRKGKTTTIELRDIFLDGKEASNILIEPGDVVSVQSDATIRINVIGPVGKPGMLTILEGQGAVEALAAAGGEGQNAALSKSKIVRAGQEIPVNLYEAIKNGKVEFNVALKDNDTLIVPTSDARVAVIGQVKNSGVQMIPDGKEWTLSQAMSQAGGPAQGAKLDGVSILRKNAQGKLETITVNYKALKTTLQGNGDFLLQDRDLVFVAQSGKADMGQISGALSLLFWPMRIFGLNL